MRDLVFPGTQERDPLPQVPDIFSSEALAFLRNLTLRFSRSLRTLLARREAAQAGYDRGARPGFLAETAHVRAGAWSVAALPAALLDRRVEICCPPEPGLVAGALDGEARVLVADFEDSLAPTLDNLVLGQETLYLAVRGQLRRREEDRRGAALMLRPRGLHLLEGHLEAAGQPVPACLFDAGLFLFHNARELCGRGATPCLSLPKLEHHLEARWWNLVLEAVERDLDLPANSIRTTLMVETLPAAFQMEELLHEQRDRATAMVLGRSNHLFSFIKTLRSDPGAVLPDPAVLDQEPPFLRAWARLLVRTCHRRGCPAIGGPGQSALDGFDGVQVDHPDRVEGLRREFDRLMPGLNQMHRIPDPVDAEQMLEAPPGPRSAAGLGQSLRVAVRCLESWLRGQGRVTVDGRIECSATAEMARMQAWQWLNHGVELDGLGRLDRCLFHAHVQDTLDRIQAEVGNEVFASGCFLAAADLLETQIVQPAPPSFLTPSAGDLLADAVLAEVN
jgi:malate synthase